MKTNLATRLTQTATGTAAKVLDRAGLLKLHFQRRSALRILCYHGVCADEVADRPWVPSNFIAAAEFKRQMQIAGRYGPIAHLPDVLPRIADGSYDGGAGIAVTFDDVAACSFAHARPILNRLGIRASFYVSTGHVTTGRLFAWDVLSLLSTRSDLADSDRPATLATPATLAPLLAQPALHKQMTRDELRDALSEAEPLLQSELDPTIRETLRPMNWDEVRQLAADGHEIGGHTVDHVILGRQSDNVRRKQITQCLADLEEHLKRKNLSQDCGTGVSPVGDCGTGVSPVGDCGTGVSSVSSHGRDARATSGVGTGSRVVGFAYPNGGPGDFGEVDTAALRASGVRYALTTRSSFADAGDLFALPRVCIGSGHVGARFALELSGLLDRQRQRRQGWA